MTTTTIDLTTVTSKNQRGNHFKIKLAEVIKSLGFTVDIERPYTIKCNTKPIRIDLVVNSILGLETKLYMDTNMAYKYVGPMPEIQTDNNDAPTKWAAVCGQDAGGFAFLRSRSIPCFAVNNLIRSSRDIINEFHIHHDELEVFILNALQ